MKYFVNRQRYWGVEEEESYIVEIAIGGRDYANADMLVSKWPQLGEGQEYSDPREAVEAAILICEEWKKTSPYAQVGMGATMGFTAPFDGKKYDDLRKAAEKLYEKAPKCTECGGLLGKEVYTHPDFMNDEKFCREYCVEQRLLEQAKLDAEFNGEEDEV